MKSSKTVLSFFLASTFLGASVRAADPQPAAPSAADIQALMAILNKLAAQAAAAEAAPNTEPEPAPEPAPAPAPKTPATPAAQPLSTALKTGSLSTSSLATSGSLGGRGPGAAVARLTEDAWRLLFPAKQPGR